jgi:ribosomal-protein-alanine N-acetyltransferase
MQAPPRIETARLVLRPPASPDLDGIFEYASDPEVTRFMSWPRHRSKMDTATFLEFAANAWRTWPAGPYIVLSRDDERVIGCAGFAFETRRVASTGYVLARNAWGRGLATEALGAMVDLAPALRLERLYALCHVDHGASAHVLEKCGFAFEGVLKGHVVFPNLSPGERSDVLSYALRFGS